MSTLVLLATTASYVRAGLICTVNARAVSIADGTAATGCDAAAIRYVDILDVRHNEFIIRVSPVLSNMVLVSSCNEGKVNGAQGKNS